MSTERNYMLAVFRWPLTFPSEPTGPQNNATAVLSAQNQPSSATIIPGPKLSNPPSGGSSIGKFEVRNQARGHRLPQGHPKWSGCNMLCCEQGGGGVTRRLPFSETSCHSTATEWSRICRPLTLASRRLRVSNRAAFTFQLNRSPRMRIRGPVMLTTEGRRASADVSRITRPKALAASSFCSGLPVRTPSRNTGRMEVTPWQENHPGITPQRCHALGSPTTIRPFPSKVLGRGPGR